MTSTHSHAADARRWIQHIDHITYAGKFQHASRFIRQWQQMGFEELVRLQTQRYPATHIALTNGKNSNLPWETMTGLSVSEDPSSPVNQFIERYGEGIQHVAYHVGPKADMESLQKSLKQQGWHFMTSVLTYEDGHHARLKQLFTAPESAYGTFVELVQRLPNAEGEIFDTFDIRNIDNLYACYDDYSRWLIQHPREHRRLQTSVSTAQMAAAAH